MPRKARKKSLIQRVKLSDDQVREYLRTAGVTSNSILQQMNKEKRDEILTKVKKLKGVSIVRFQE